MEPFLTIDETSIDKNLEASSREGYSLREAARGIVIDANEAVALLHVTRDHYYKLPGGGIDEGEEPLDAFARELMEEIGCQAEVLHAMGTILEQRYYWNMTQISHCYIARQTGEKGEPNFTDGEHEQGFEVVWVKNIDEAISLLQQTHSESSGELARNIAFMRLRDVAIAKKAKEILAR